MSRFISVTEDYSEPRAENEMGDENGIRTIIEHVVNEDGKKVKVSSPLVVIIKSS